jgi:hypothetical protein
VHGALYAHLLERVRLTSIDGDHTAEGANDAREFGDEYVFFENQRNWERLRTVGRLPLFGLSYTALILIPIVFYGLEFYNSKVDLIREWAAQVAAMPDQSMRFAAEITVKHLHTQPIPSFSLVLLGSTVLLAAASTLYTLFCPSRIKEFSCDQWCDQLGRSLLALLATGLETSQDTPHLYGLLCFGRHRSTLGYRLQGLGGGSVYRQAIRHYLALVRAVNGSELGQE